ncbi:MAG: hypothetical protein ACM3S1_05730 [Hyphomicrobiales bacterium]
MALLRGKVVSFDSTGYTASIRLDGSAPQTLDNVRVALNIASAAMTAGRRVILDTGDHGDLADVVVLAVYS